MPVQNTAEKFSVYFGTSGLTLTTTLSKAGGSFSSVAPTITDASNGYYIITPLAAHRDMIGVNSWLFVSGDESRPYVERVESTDNAAILSALGNVPNQSQVQSAAAAALTAYDPPTRAEATADKEEILNNTGLLPGVAPTIERVLGDEDAIRFSWPVDGATITGQVSKAGGAYVNVEGSITQRANDNGFWYQLAYHANDRQLGSQRYKFTDGTYTRYVNLLVNSASAEVDLQPVLDAVADVPTNAEFELRTLPSADYFVVGDDKVGPGGVAYPITVQVNGQPVDGVAVWVSTDEAGTNVIAGTLYTNSNGVTPDFMLDVGNYYAWAQKAGINIQNPKAFEVVVP